MTLTEETSQTLVSLNAKGVQPGEYNLILQSFDQNSSVKSTLKTDQITIIVTGYSPLSFTSDLELQNLTLGVPYEWELPGIKEGSFPLIEVIVEPDAAIQQSISFSTSQNKFYFDGSAYLQ